MGIKIERLTDRDIRDFRREIEGYKKRQKTFLALGFVFLGLTILFIALSILFGILMFGYTESYISLYLMYCLFSLTVSLGTLTLIGMIAMFIVRGAVFNKKIENRERAIEEYEYYKKEQKQGEAEVVDIQ